jgi:uncharacterized protein
MRRFPWIRLRKKTAPELPFEPPIYLGNFSTGEYFHEQTPRDRLIRRLILERADLHARRLGVDRREFLASAAGMATSLAVLNAVGGCGSDGGPGNGASTDGGFAVPDAAATECELAEDILDTSKTFIFDIQTHHVEREGDWREVNPQAAAGLAQYFATFNGCTSEDPVDCIDAAAYVQNIFLDSDTTVAVLSGFPAPLCADRDPPTQCGNPLDNDALARSRDRVNALARSQRVLNHCQVNPNDNLELQLAVMERIHAQYGVAGWKAYPPWGPTGTGWFLDDPKIGIPFIEKARSLGTKTICIHKGIVFPGWDANTAHPRDVGVVAKMFPDVNFIVYHSGIELPNGTTVEGPYDPKAPFGIDRLVKSVLDNELGVGSNVYAELGSVWFQVYTDPVAAQHVIGKLMLHLGEDNVLWGSECIWLGSPQPQIEAFLAFEISTKFQEQYGYPALTAERKAKILGLSAARLYGIDPEETRCRVKLERLGRLKEAMDGELGRRRWAFQQMGGPRTRREWFNFRRVTAGKPG